MLSVLGIIFRAATGSFIGRAMAIGVAALAALGINNMYQRSKGAAKERAKIVERSNDVAKERSAKVRKIRRGIKPGSAWKRLRDEYPDTD